MSDETRAGESAWCCAACGARQSASPRARGARVVPPPPRWASGDDRANLAVLATATRAVASLAPPPVTVGTSRIAAALAPMVRPSSLGWYPLPHVDDRPRPGVLAGVVAGLAVGALALGVQASRERIASFGAHDLASPAPAPAMIADAPAALAMAPPTPVAPVNANAKAAAPVAATAPRAVVTTPAAKRADHADHRAAVPAIAPTPPATIAEPKPRNEPASDVTEASGEAAARLVEPIARVAGDEDDDDDDRALPPFSREAASSALAAVAAGAGGCREADGPSGVARVSVTFAPSGLVTRAVVEGTPFAGTTAGGCLARLFREARVQPFAGGPVTVHKSLSLF